MDNIKMAKGLLNCMIALQQVGDKATNGDRLSVAAQWALFDETVDPYGDTPTMHERMNILKNDLSATIKSLRDDVIPELQEIQDGDEMWGGGDAYDRP